MYALALCAALLLAWVPTKAWALDRLSFGQSAFGDPRSHFVSPPIKQIGLNREGQNRVGMQSAGVAKLEGKFARLDNEPVRNRFRTVNVEQLIDGKWSSLPDDAAGMQLGDRATNIGHLHVEAKMASFLSANDLMGQNSLGKNHIDAGIFSRDERLVAVRSGIRRPLRPLGGTVSDVRGHETNADLDYRGVIKPFGSVGLPDIRDRSDGVAVILALVGVGASLAALTVGGAWLLENRHRAAGCVCLLLVALAMAFLWWSA